MKVDNAAHPVTHTINLSFKNRDLLQKNHDICLIIYLIKHERVRMGCFKLTPHCSKEYA